MKKIALLLLLLMASLLAKPEASSAQTTGGAASQAQFYLNGTVYGESFSNPLFGASVSLVNKITFSVQKQITNKGGQFAFIAPAGSYSLNVIAGNYQPATQPISLSNGPTTTYFTLKKLGSSSNPIISGSPGSDTGSPTGDTNNSGSSPIISQTPQRNTSNTTVTSGGKIISRSNCVITKIGNPTQKLVLPPECSISNTLPSGGAGNNTGATPGDSNGILPWADKITSSLRPAYWGYLNNQEADWCNSETSSFQDTGGSTGYCANKRSGVSTDDLYWCTFLVIDTFNLIGKSGLNPQDHLGVVYMMPFFQNTPGYVFLPYDPYNVTDQNKDTLKKVKPGMPWFLAYDPTQTISQEHTGLVYTISIDNSGDGEIVTRESNSDQTSHTFPIDGWRVITFDGFPLRGFGGIQ